MMRRRFRMAQSTPVLRVSTQRDRSILSRL
jgi:hypothetical protein